MYYTNTNAKDFFFFFYSLIPHSLEPSLFCEWEENTFTRLDKITTFSGGEKSVNHMPSGERKVGKGRGSRPGTNSSLMQVIYATTGQIK